MQYHGNNVSEVYGFLTASHTNWLTF